MSFHCYKKIEWRFKRMEGGVRGGTRGGQARTHLLHAEGVRRLDI